MQLHIAIRAAATLDQALQSSLEMLLISAGSAIIDDEIVVPVADGTTDYRRTDPLEH